MPVNKKIKIHDICLTEETQIASAEPISPPPSSNKKTPLALGGLVVLAIAVIAFFVSQKNNDISPEDISAKLGEEIQVENNI